MRIASLAAALLLGGLPSVAAAQRAPDPVPIEEWSLEKVSAMGQQIYRHDVAAWVATDEGKAFMRRSADAWAAAHERDGVGAEVAKGAADRTYAAYTGEAPGPEME